MRMLNIHESGSSPTKSLYSVPAESPVVYWLVENLEAVDFTGWDQTCFGWAVHEQTFRHRDAGWMARLVSLSALSRAMLPELRARWKRSMASSQGDITLAVGKEALTLRIMGTDVELLEATSPGAPSLALTPQVFTQVLFGYVPILNVVQPAELGQLDDARSALPVLFPTGRAYIPPSDWF